MSTGGIVQWQPFEQRSPTVFLTAGVLLLGYAILQGINSFLSVTLPSAVLVLYGGIALLAAVFALVGFYPRLRDHTPRLAATGLATAVLAGLLTVSSLFWVVGTILLSGGLPEIPAEAPAWTAVASLLGFLLLAVSFFISGVASLRTAALSRTVGLLLLVPTAAWVGLVVGNALLDPAGHYLAVVAYIPISLAVLAIGYRLRSTRAEPARIEATTHEAPPD